MRHAAVVFGTGFFLAGCTAAPDEPPAFALAVQEVADTEYVAVLEPATPSGSTSTEVFEASALDPQGVERWPAARYEGKQYVEIRATTVPVPDRWSHALLRGSSSTALLLEQRCAHEVLHALQDRSDLPPDCTELSVVDGSSGSVRVVDQRSFVRGYRYVSMPGAKMPEPVVAVVEQGEVFEGKASLVDEHTVALELELSNRELEPPAQHVARPRPKEVLRLEVPIVRSETLRANTSLDLGQTLLLRRPGFRDGERWTFVDVRVTSGGFEQGDETPAVRTAVLSR